MIIVRLQEVGDGKVQGEAGTFVGGGVPARAMRHAVVEEECATGFHFDGDGLGFVHATSNMVVAAAIAKVFEGRSEIARDDVHGAVGNGDVMECDPHACALGRVRQTEVGVILGPRCAVAGLAGLEKNLIEVMNNRVANQLAYDVDDLGTKRKRSVELALGCDRTNLEVLGGLGMCLAVAVSGDIAHKSFTLEAFQLGAHGGDLAVVEEMMQDDVAVVTILSELVSG